MDELNVSHNLLPAVSGHVECTHMYALRQSSYRTLVSGRLVVGGGRLLRMFLNPHHGFSGNVQVHVLKRPYCAKDPNTPEIAHSKLK